MTKEDYTQFVMLWQTYQSIYRPQAPQTALAAVFEALKDFSICDITRALKEYSLNAVRAPVPADIRKLILQKAGSFQQFNALSFLAKIDQNLDRGYDYVSLDWKGVLAFKATYESLVNYCNLTSFEEQKLKNSFVENYKRSIQTREAEIDHLIAGIYHDSSQAVMVRTLEEYTNTKSIIAQIYGNRKISLSLSKSDPAYKQVNCLPAKEYKLSAKAEAKAQAILDKFPQAGIDGLEAVLKALI